MRSISFVWSILVLLYLIFLGLVSFTTIFQGTPLEAFGMTALMVPYALHQVGLPVLENNGFSGWGWSSPNILGWFLSAIAWLAFYWLVAFGIVRLILRSRPKQ